MKRVERAMKHLNGGLGASAAADFSAYILRLAAEEAH